MSNQPIEVEYGKGMEALEEALSAVVRPGSFAVADRVMAAMPRLRVKGVGPVSFPVPAAQAERLAKAAQQAPYGRGEETILDTSVRKVRQISPAEVELGGKGWETAFPAILSKAAAGLGCGPETVSAELYKLLIYDEGGFFLPHRDTEKAPGMFGTLVIALPSDHAGGDLHVRHAGEEKILSLTTDEPSELVWAAFYADCQHEVKPVTRGHRVCLIYNLIQKRSRGAALKIPDFSAPARTVARLLGGTFSGPESVRKLAWLLEHQYSPAELSFPGLKNADAARASVLLAAAAQAGCVVHLGMIHIEETGAAEPHYDVWESRGRRSRWRDEEDGDDDGEEEETDDDGSGEEASYDIVEVIETGAAVDTWRAPDGSSPDWGSVPVENGELLPEGALDGVKPDRDGVSEATGNEGATYERSYHRAVLTVWPVEGTVEVLLQAGPEAVAPWLETRVRSLPPDAVQERRKTVRLATGIVTKWAAGNTARNHWSTYQVKPVAGARAAMLRALTGLGASAAIATFIQRVVAPEFDGSENEALRDSLRLLEAPAAGSGMEALISARFPRDFDKIVALLSLLSEEPPATVAGWADAAVDALCRNLPKLPAPRDPHAFRPAGSRPPWSSVREVPEQNAAAGLTELLAAMAKIGGTAGLSKLADAMRASPPVFDPLLILTPVLAALAALPPSGPRKGTARSRARQKDNHPLAALWHHTAESLLLRSTTPPQPPADWSQPMPHPCTCPDCAELAAFVSDPVERTHRFRVNAGRRQHLHEAIERNGLDMTHITERRGSPQTLVCTKTQRRYELRLAQYHADQKAFATLVETAPAIGSGDDPLLPALRKAARP